MDVRLADREAQIMEVLWNKGPSTVTEVRESLEADLAYTTVLSILRTLEEKGFVGHDQDGRAHRYAARVDLESARRSASRALVRKMFEGSTELLLTHLVTDDKLSTAQIERIERLLEAQKRNRG